MESNISTLRRQLDELCVRVTGRMKELGDKDIMAYRSDPSIRELQSRICSIYRQAVGTCKTYGEAVKVCETFRDYPECLNQLMLSEEVACPVTAKDTGK
jgi:hypothetical protein